MKAQPIPKHISATFHCGEVFDLVMTLRSAIREFEGVPESIEQIADTLEGAWSALCGEMPQPIGEAITDDGEAITDDGAAAA